MTAEFIISRQWTPRDLFYGPTNGFWYDFSDFTTLFQDTAGATAIGGSGNPIGRVLDKSSKGNHANRYSADTNRPLWTRVDNNIGYGDFDGTNDGFAIATSLVVSKNANTMAAGVWFDTLTSQPYLIQFNTSVGNPDRMGWEVNTGPDVIRLFLRRNDDTDVSANLAGPAVVVSQLNYMFAEANWLSATGSFVHNQLVAGPTATGQTAAASSALTPNLAWIGLGGAAANPLDGRIYQIVFLDRLLSWSEKYQLSRFICRKMGKGLP